MHWINTSSVMKCYTQKVLRPNSIHK